MRLIASLEKDFLLARLRIRHNSLGIDAGGSLLRLEALPHQSVGDRCSDGNAIKAATMAAMAIPMRFLSLSSPGVYPPPRSLFGCLNHTSLWKY